MAADYPYPKRGALAVPDESAMDYADLHHLTALPESIKKFKLKTFSLLGLEQALQQRINQHTSRDSDRFRQILRLFKEQTRRGDTDEDTPLMGVNRAQFATILALLGLFATVDQTNALFAKYDTNGDGALTVHEFLTRCRPADYVGARWHDMKEGGDGYVRGKKMYGAGATGGGVNEDGTDTRPHASSSALSRGNLKVSATSEHGTGRVRAQTPTDALCHLTIERIAAKLRDKLRCRGAIGSTLSFPRTRRHFAKTFEYYDKDGRGTVDEEGLRHALDDINFPLGSAHRSLIMQNFAVGDRLDYVAFIRFVFPQDNCSTSLRLGELEPPEPAALSMESGSFAPSQSGTPFGRSAAFTAATAAPYADSKEQAPSASSGSMSARGFGSTHPSTRAFIPRPPGAAPVDASQWSPAAGRPNAPYDGGVAATMTTPRRPITGHASGSQSARGAAPRGLYAGSTGSSAAAGLPPVVSVGGRTFVRTADAPPSAFPSSSFAYPSASSSHVPAFARPPLPAPPASVYGGSGTIRFG